MHCLRCGTKTEENRSFCDGCAHRMREPLEDSPNLPTKISLPNRQEKPAPKRPEAKKERKKRPWRWILSTLLLFLFCTALLLQGGWYFTAWLNNEAKLGQMAREQEALQTEIATLKDNLSQAEQDNMQLRELVNSLNAELANAQIELVDLQQKISYMSQSIVFVNEKSGVFHRSDCVGLDTREFTAYVKDDAVQKGHTPCELCLP